MNTLPKAIRTYARAHCGVNPFDSRATTKELFDPALHWSVRVHVPSPVHVARYLLARHLNDEAPTFRAPEGVLCIVGDERRVLSRDEIVAILRDLVAAMPERVTGLREYSQSDLYRGLRAFTRLAPAKEVDAYLAAIADALPRTLKPAPVPRAPRAPRPAPMTPAERQRVSRARRRERELATARAYLEMWRDDDTGKFPTEAVPRREVVDGLIKFADMAAAEFDAAHEAHENALGAWELARFRDRDSDTPRPRLPRPVNEWPDIAAESGYPLHPARVTARRAVALLRELGMIETRSGDQRRYRFPEALTDTTVDTERTSTTMHPDYIDRQADSMARLADATERAAEAAQRLAAANGLLAQQADAFAHGDKLTALHLQRERFAATGTDGIVIDATARFGGDRR